MLLSLCCLAQTAPALADYYDGEDIDPSKPLPFGVVRSEDAIRSPHATGDMMLLQSEYALKNGHFDAAILYAQQALVEDPEDADIHIAYAQALETKLRHQLKEQKDLRLYMATVREWLLTARSERGEEKGLTNSKGIGLPKMNKLYQDPDRQGLALAHLVGLVGYPPKPFETDRKYLKRVETQAEKMVSAKIVAKKDDQKQTDGKSTAPNSSSKQEAERPDARTR
jgi:hypothetical protein